jgi:hypothetical protein
MNAQEHVKAISRDTSNAEENPHCGSWAAEIVCAAHICAALDRLTAAVEAQTARMPEPKRPGVGAFVGRKRRGHSLICDGEHAAPACASPMCWCRVSPRFAAMQVAMVRVAGGVPPSGGCGNPGPCQECPENRALGPKVAP